VNDDDVLRARGIGKVYPGTVALDGVDFALQRGSVHALIGENGAGKSTLVKILAGVEKPTSGSLSLDGAEVTLASAADAASRGIAIVHQELQRFPNLSVAENLFIGRELRTRWRAVDHRAQEASAREQLAKLGQPIDPRTVLGHLPLGLQQLVEIARALTLETRVLLMDEPTSALSAAEVDVLFRVIRDLRTRGVAIVYISHRLEELITIADAVTVLRDGRVAGHALTSDVSVPWIVERMTGGTTATRPSRAASPAASPAASAARERGASPVLRVRGLTLPPRSGRTALDAIDLSLDTGEIVGIYALMGAGRTELLESLMGVHRDARGEVLLDGRPLQQLATDDRVRAGLTIVPEDRQRAGLVTTMTVAQNMTLSCLGRFTTAGWLSSAREAEAARAMGGDVRLKTPSIGAPVTALSGGNQQKVIISRALLSGPRVVLLDEPSRGVDVGARAEIIQCMRRFAADGLGVLFTTSDLNEIFAAADRVIVMSRGRITGQFPASEATAATLASCASVHAVTPVAPEGRLIHA
jgi:erythritol transport system ATP-binding protein